MAEDEEAVSNRKSPKNSNKEGTEDNNKQIPPKPDLGIEESKYNTAEGETEDTVDATKTGGGSKKEDNPFSFRHFLKRDLSLPGTSTYENTGARPKVYSNTVQHSPTDLVQEHLRRERPSHTKEFDYSPRRKKSDSESSSELPYSEMDNNDSHKSGLPYYQRPNIASEPLGMPSLPDFVQDHLLVEQVYLNSNAPLSLDMDKLPDFTFNTNFDRGNRRNVGGVSYDYEEEVAEPGAGWCPSLDLPAGAVDPPHLNLDLTESVNPLDRRNPSPRNNFPLDLPPSSGAESMRLPDFLPVHPGRISPETEPEDYQIAQQLAEARAELLLETRRRIVLEGELESAKHRIASLESQLLRSSLAGTTSARGSDYWQPDPGAGPSDTKRDSAGTAAETDYINSRLRHEIKTLKEELAESAATIKSLRAWRLAAGRDVRSAANAAETHIRQLLEGVEQLRNLSLTMDPP